MISYHHGGATAEGLVTAKLSRALHAAGHEVRVVAARDENDAPTADTDGAVVDRIPDDGRDIPGWRRTLDDRARLPGGARLWGRLAAGVNVLDGASARERAWAEAAATQARDLLRSAGPFDVVHSRLNPVTSHLAALSTVGPRRGQRFPWCAYWSDPWPHHRYPPPYRFTVGPAARQRGEALLVTMAHRADSLVFPAARLRDHMLRDRLEVLRGKAFVAPHLGTVPAGGVPAVGDEATGATLRLRHSGFLMKERRIEPLYEALERFFADHPEARGRLQFELAGRYPGGIVPEAPDALADTVRFAPWMPSDEVARWVRAADVAVLVEAAMAVGIFFPSKLADYLAARKPILALSPRRGVAADLLAAGGGVLAPPDDPAAIAEALDTLWSHHVDGRLQALAPSADAAAAVAPAAVVPRYLEAFQHAIAEGRP